MKKKRVTAFFLATMLFSSSAVGASAASTYTWKYQNHNWYYVTSTGKVATGWVQYKGAWYFLGSNGVRQTGWLSYGNHRYFLQKSGARATGWLVYQGKKYYFSPSGEMVTGQKYIAGKPYLFTSSGALSTAKLTGWFRDGTVVMYFNSNGTNHTGWLTIGNKKYYFDQSGFIHKGWLSVNNKKYFFSQDGSMQTGWLTVGSNQYYLGADGTMQTGWLTVGGSTYYLGTDGIMNKGWLTVGGKKYYFAQDGKMKTGIQTIGNQMYYFGTDGVQQVGGWKQINNKWYYLRADGTIYKGWLTDGGKKYYLGTDGVKVTGWLRYQNQLYYFNSDGTMATGWILSNNKWYYLNSNGVMQTGFITYQGNTYYLNQNGDRHIGWLTLGANEYYFDSSGKMLIGQQVIGGKTYNFFDNGILNTGPVITKTQYSLALQEMLNVQMNLNPPPQTDLYRNQNAFVSGQYIQLNTTDPTKGTVTASALNAREAANTSAYIYGTLSKGQTVSIVSTVKTTTGTTTTGTTWYEIKYVTWRNAKPVDVQTYLDPNNFSQGSTGYWQFLLLNKYAGTTAADLNTNILAGKGILAGMGDAFIKASQQNNVNEIYLIAHALLETGNGTSKLATGVQLDTVNGKKLDKPVTVYNMFGIGALDSCPESCGAQTAYNNGWFTPEAAIIGGAEFISSSYINNPSTQQNTLYKMRWNPANPGNHEYATDISWAFNQVSTIKKLYDSLSSYTLYYDIPIYK